MNLLFCIRVLSYFSLCYYPSFFVSFLRSNIQYDIQHISGQLTGFLVLDSNGESYLDIYTLITVYIYSPFLPRYIKTIGVEKRASCLALGPQVKLGK